jgi:hypothetical protein
MSTITYQLSTDFSSGFNSSQFQALITSSSSITTILQSVNSDADADLVEIIFETDLIQSELDALNALVQAYEYIPLISTPPLIYTITPIVSSINTESYSDLKADFVYDYNTVTALHNIKIIGYVESGLSYTIRIFDATNRVTLTEQTFTNTSKRLNDIPFVSDLVLTSDAIIEFHCKCSSNTVANIVSIIVYYN